MRTLYRIHKTQGGGHMHCCQALSRFFRPIWEKILPNTDTILHILVFYRGLERKCFIRPKSQPKKLTFSPNCHWKKTKNIFFSHFWPQLTKIPLPKDMFVASFEILYFYNFRLPGNSGHTCPAVDCRPSPVMAYCYQRLASSQQLIVARTRVKVVLSLMCKYELAAAGSYGKEI